MRIHGRCRHEFFQNVFENSNALVCEAVNGVWLASEGPEVAIFFEAYAFDPLHGGRRGTWRIQ
jgi:hypothetical protein